MEYRKLGKTGLNVSVIGLGTEYLVKASRETVLEVVQKAVSEGINLFDVLFAEPDYRDNFGAAFRGIRDKVLITGHLFTWDPIETVAAGFEDHLARLGTDYVDILFVSCCDREDIYERAVGPGGHLELAMKYRREGKARYIGFSSHTVPVAMKAVKSGFFDLLMFPINPAFDVLPGTMGTEDLQDLWKNAGNEAVIHKKDGMIPERKELYLECAKQGVGLIAMKPFAGGWMFSPVAGAGATPVQLLNYSLSQPGVTSVIPGASCTAELEQDIRWTHATEAEKDYSAVLAGSRWNLKGTCMYCNHCQPCSSGIDIAQVNRMVDAAGTAITAELKQEYDGLQMKASDCAHCGICMERCPFGVDVIGKMEKAVGLYE